MEAEVRLDGPKADVPSPPDPCPRPPAAGVSELRIRPLPDWDPPTSLPKACNKDANSTFLSSPLNGIKVTETLPTRLHAPCAAQRGAEQPGGARKAASGTGGKRLLWGQPISDMMHNHIPNQLGFVSVVPGTAWCGDEDEDDYLQWIFIAREPQPEEGTLGLSPSPSGPQGKT
ncbi:hypothetical protein llap_8402 [Limosa lapponica baueri]|uniref:Uncharacterized protein n=1 Tax=Limosa lapponica baueri TaxID=1758121 RepID=A0A2I0U5K6_LIMLA|nr:hypothetical protein llap_8402 [Limosa lapponica baueri]